MHRVHYFDTSEQAFDACLADDQTTPEGDVIVILSEGVVGLASTCPIAVTREAGVLQRIPSMARDVLLSELVHDAAQLRNAVETALVHRLSVEAQYLTFASTGHQLRRDEAAIILRFDDLLVIADAIDRRVDGLRDRLETVRPDSSQGLFLAHGISRLTQARHRLGDYTQPACWSSRTIVQ